MRAILFVLLFPALAFGADWKLIKGTDTLYDAASMVRDGDVVTIWLKSASHSNWGLGKSSVNCAKRTARDGDMAPREIEPDSDAEIIMKAVCKKTYEFWK